MPAVFATNYRLGMTQSWNLSVEQSFGKQFVMHLAYVGAQSFHQATTVDQNPGRYSTNSALSGRTPHLPQLQPVIQVQDGATSSYQALQAGVEKHMSTASSSRPTSPGRATSM